MIDEIVERSLHPPAEDFDAFYGRSRDRLYRALALTLGDADIAADAVNEAMTRALERWDKVGGNENPSGSRVIIASARYSRSRFTLWKPSKPRITPVLKRNWVICCARLFFTPSWPRSGVNSISMTRCTLSSTN